MVQRASRRAARNRPRGARGFPHARRAAGVRTLASTLNGTILRLRHVQSAARVAAAALRQQNCELDEDIAVLLRRSVCDRIEDQIVELEAACQVLGTRLRRV